MSDGLFSFPNPVNEKAARTVAAGVVAIAACALVTGWLWLTIPLAYGFVARVLTGPTLSPLGQLATRVIAPRLGPAKLVPGPPKRFAQGIGAVLSVVAAICCLAFGWNTLSLILLGLILVAALLESVLAVCIGCTVFAALMRIHVIPESVCLECADVSRRIDQALAAKS